MIEQTLPEPELYKMTSGLDNNRTIDDRSWYNGCNNLSHSNRIYYCYTIRSVTDRKADDKPDRTYTIKDK